MLSLTEFYSMLEKHDWYYQFSDDGRVYDRGVANFKKLITLASQSQAHQKLFDDYLAYVNSQIGSEKLPKPEKPKETV